MARGEIIMPVIEHKRLVWQRLALQDPPPNEQLFVTRVVIACSLASLAFWIGTLWAVVHFLA